MKQHKYSQDQVTIDGTEFKIGLHGFLYRKSAFGEWIKSTQDMGNIKRSANLQLSDARKTRNKEDICRLQSVILNIECAIVKQSS